MSDHHRADERCNNHAGLARWESSTPLVIVANPRHCSAAADREGQGEAFVVHDGARVKTNSPCRHPRRGRADRRSVDRHGPAEVRVVVRKWSRGDIGCETELRRRHDQRHHPVWEPSMCGQPRRHGDPRRRGPLDVRKFRGRYSVGPGRAGELDIHELATHWSARRARCETFAATSPVSAELGRRSGHSLEAVCLTGWLKYGFLMPSRWRDRIEYRDADALAGCAVVFIDDLSGMNAPLCWPCSVLAGARMVSRCRRAAST